MKIIRSVIILFLFSLPLQAQEIGASYSKLWSDDNQLKDPAGYGIHLLFPIKKLAIKAEYNYAKAERTYFGQISPGYLLLPEDKPIEEYLISKSQIKSYDISLFVRDLIGSINPFQLNFGAGVSLNHLEGSRRGLTSGDEISYSSTDRIGILLSASVSYPRLFNLPVKLELLYKLKALTSEGSEATDSENVYVNAIGIKQLSLGISYML